MLIARTSRGGTANVPAARLWLASRVGRRWDGYSADAFMHVPAPSNDSAFQARYRLCSNRGKPVDVETEEAWESWLETNPLPGTGGFKRDSGTTSRPRSKADKSSQAEGHERFHWRDTSRMMTSLQERGYDMSWDSSAALWRGESQALQTGLTEAPPVSRAGVERCEIVVPRILPQVAQTNPSLNYFLQRISKSAAESPEAANDSPTAVRCSKCLVVLLAANAAALGIWDNQGRLLRHKVFTGYTVRAKQGKSQLYYAQQGGGAGSVGGRMRAREVKRLFGSIAARLQDWAADIDKCDQLFYSGDVRAWNEVFAANPSNLDRHDDQWVRVGMSVHKPRLKELQRVYSSLGYGEVRYFRGDGT